MSMIGLVLVKKDMLYYVQYISIVKGMGQGLSDQHVYAWIKRREVVNGVREIRNEKLREHQYRKGFH